MSLRQPNDVLNCSSLRSLDSQSLRDCFWPISACRDRLKPAKSRSTFQPKKPGVICEAFALKVDQNLQSDILC
ncbi:hypothetical protein EMIT0357P_40023 [Pseudomonas marginalis]